MEIKVLDINKINKIIEMYTKNKEISKLNYITRSVNAFKKENNFDLFDAIDYLKLIDNLQYNFFHKIKNNLNSELYLLLYSILITTLANEFKNREFIFKNDIDSQLIFSYANGSKKDKVNIRETWFNYKRI